MTNYFVVFYTKNIYIYIFKLIMGLKPGVGVVKLFLYAISIILMIGFVPNVLDIDPKSYKIELVKSFTGPYEANNRLDAAVRLFENDLEGPESLALYKGSIYTGLHTGEIVRINGEKVTKVAQIGKTNAAGSWEPEISGRPLGMRVTKDGILYTVDAYYGLYTIDLQTGAKKALITMTEKIDGLPMTFPDDLAVDENGVVYLSDASTKWPLNEIVYQVMEHCDRGRIIKYDPKTGKASVIMDKIHFPNGVQLTHDGKGLLVSELLKHRILRYNLEGDQKGKVDVFATMPGEPDNIRPSKRGGYWVALVVARNASAPIFSDYFSEYPKVRKIAAKISYGLGSLLRYISNYVTYPQFKTFAYKFQKLWDMMPIISYKGVCMVVELDSNGQAVQTLQSEDTRYCIVSEVLEHDDYLYIGSFIHPYLTKVKL